MQQIHEPNIVHILDEFERINVLILANISYIFQEQDQQKSENKQSPLNKSSAQPFGIPLWATQKSAQLGLKKEPFYLFYLC